MKLIGHVDTHECQTRMWVSENDPRASLGSLLLCSCGSRYVVSGRTTCYEFEDRGHKSGHKGFEITMRRYG